jgi:hypothetical protein
MRLRVSVGSSPTAKVAEPGNYRVDEIARYCFAPTKAAGSVPLTLPTM